MTGFTLETNSFGSRLFLKSSPNRIIHTYSKAIIVNGVQLELTHNNTDDYDFVISIRKNKTKDDDGLSYAYALESYKITPYLNDNGNYYAKHDLSEYFDDCPRGTWQLQVFLKNKITKLTEHFIYIDLVFTNVLQIKQETNESKELQIRNYFSLPEQNNIVVNNATGNLYYSYLIYREDNSKFVQYYQSDIYPMDSILNINWQEHESYKTIEKHILTGLNSESYIYVLITTDSKQSIDLPEFTYLKYVIRRTNNLQIVGNSEVRLGERNNIPELNLKLKSKFEPSIIPSYSVRCEWILLGANEKIKRTLLTTNFDNKLQNTATINGVKNDIIVPNILDIDSHLDKSFWNTKILPENYLGEYSNDVLIRVTVTGFDSNSVTDLYQQPVCIDEVVCNYYLTRVSNKPTINIKNMSLGQISIPPSIDYTVRDDDSSKIIIKETIDLSGKDEELFLKQFTINEINSKIELNSPSNITKKLNTENFSRLTDGKHTYGIYIGDGVNEPSVTRISFEKLPNIPPVITGIDNTNVEEIYLPKEFKYSVTDSELDDLYIEEYYDDILINSYTFSYSENDIFDERSVNYDLQFKKSEINTTHKVTVKVSDGANIVKRIYTFKKIQGPPPTISGIDLDLKKVYKAKPIEYTVKDPSEGALNIIEYFDNEKIREYSSMNEITSSLNYSEKFNIAIEGKHNITIVASNGFEETRRVYTLEKINNTIDKFLITPQNIGDISTSLDVSVDVWNVLNNKMTYSIVLNGKTISSNNDFVTIVEHIDNITKYRIQYSMNENSSEFNKLLENNTLKFVITDIEECVYEIEYIFRKIYKNPKITVSHNKFDIYMLQIKNQIIQCYNKNNAKLIIKLNDMDILFNGVPYIDIPKNTYENQYSYSFSLSNSYWDSLEKFSENTIKFILKDIVTNETDEFEYLFVKGHQDILTWKPNVSQDGLLEWSVDNSQNIPEPVNIKGEQGKVGKTPSISIGKVTSINTGEQPSVEISNDDPENPILDFKLPKAEGVSRYVSDVPSTEKVGGLDIGFVAPEGIEVTELIYQMLHPYAQPNVTISSNPPSGVKKKGVQISVNSITARVEKKSNAISYVKLYKDNVELVHFESNNDNVYTYNTPINIQTDTTFKFDVNDGKTTLSKSIEFSFVDPMYYGNSVTIPIDSTGLTELISNKSNKTLTFTATELSYQVFLYPSSYGKLTSITDGTGFSCLSGFNCTTLMLNDVEYYMYCTKSPSLVNGYKYNFKF